LTFTHIKRLGLAGVAVLSLAACSNEPEPISDIDADVTQDTFDEEIEVRDGALGQAYDVGNNVIQVNSIELLDDEDGVDYFAYQAVRVNATIENTTEEVQEFDVWSQLRVGSVRDRDSFGALQLNAYGLDGFEVPELNDNLFIELDAGESVTYDFIFDVIVPEEDNDVHAIYQINPLNHYEDGYIVWEIDGFADLEPSEVEIIDWDAIEDEGEPVEGPEDSEAAEADEAAEDNAEE